MVKGWETAQEILCRYKASGWHCESGQALAQAAQRGGGVSALGGVQIHYGPDQLAITGPTSSWAGT